MLLPALGYSDQPEVVRNTHSCGSPSQSGPHHGPSGNKGVGASFTCSICLCYQKVPCRVRPGRAAEGTHALCLSGKPSAVLPNVTVREPWEAVPASCCSTPESLVAALGAIARWLRTTDIDHF